MKSGIAVALIVVVFLVWQVFAADMLSLSLNGFDFAYANLVRRDLGLPSTVSDRLFCGGEAVEAELRKTLAEMQCVPPADVPRPCDPVSHQSRVPTYVFPASDHLTTDMAVVSPVAAALARHLQSATPTEFLAAGADSSRAAVAGQRGKTMVFKQCDGYGYVEIKQDYYTGLLPHWLSH
jgi:hypothetical protein